MKISQIPLKNGIVSTLLPWNMNIAYAIEVAFRNKAHVAGGFARLFASKLDFKTFIVKDKDDLYESIIDYLEHGSDVDLFFESDDGFNEFLRLFKSKQILQKLNGKIVDFEIDGFRIQAVNCGQSIIQNISGFDILNAAVAFDSKNAFIPDEWFSLELENMIHVENWKFPLRTIQRINRWMTRQSFKKMSAKTASELADYALLSIDYIKEERKKQQQQNPKTFNTSYINVNDGGENDHESLVVDEGSLIDWLKPLLPNMTSDQLLMLTWVVHPSEQFYNFKTPFQILLDRKK